MLGLPVQKDAWYRYTWDRSLFLVYRRKELQSIMAELDFSQQDIDGLEVVGRGKPFSSVTVEEHSPREKSLKSSSEDTMLLDSLTNFSDMVPMPILGPSLLFCGKPACWIRGSNPDDKKNIGIAVRLTFETLEGEKTSSELTVVNNGTVAIWCDPARGNQTLYLLLQVSECWHLQGILGIWDSSYPLGRRCTSGHSPCYLTDPGPFYG